MRPAPAGSANLLLVLTLLATLGSLLAAYCAYRAEAMATAADGRLAAREAQLDQILAEVTRQRIEQSAGTMGPPALLQKLATYAPLLASSRTAEPDFLNAKKEMDAVLRAFGSFGKDATAQVLARLTKLHPEKDHEEVRWLLEATIATDRDAAIPLLREVLLGHRLPSPRLRWLAADRLIELDPPLAQQLLRQILTTESFRGVDLSRASAYGAAVPDQAALAATGFYNFVVKYARSGDPETVPTLLMVAQRADSDSTTVQECVEELGRRRAAVAADTIQKLYQNPPGRVENPIFLGKCLDALAAIQGEAARPWFEAMLAKTENPVVANRLKDLLSRPIVAPDAPAANGPATGNGK